MRVDVDASFVHLVYPFSHDADHFMDRMTAFDQADHQGRNRSLPVWREAKFPQDDLLSHVARYLNPPEDRVPTARLWTLDSTQLDAYGLAGKADWCLLLSKQRIAFRVGPQRNPQLAVQLALFQDGVGFLTVRADPVSPDLADWLTFAHYSRFVRGQRNVQVELSQRVGDPATGSQRVEPFFPEEAGGTAAHPDGRGQLVEILEALLMTGCLEGEHTPWWREIFIPGHVLPFVGLFAEDVDRENAPELLYRLRNFFHADQEIFPTKEDLQIDHPSLLPYAEGQWFIFSLDGGAFLACDAPENPFFRENLPEHLRTSYFLIFMLALHQRFALMMLSEQVAEHWLDCGSKPCETERELVFRRIRDTLFSFTARAYLSQVMQREHHHRCYRKWLDVFQITELFQEVRGEVQDMHDFLMMQSAEERRVFERNERERLEAQAELEAAREKAAEQRATHLEQLLTAIAAILGVPALALTYLQVIEETSCSIAGVVTAASMALGGLAYLLVRHLVNRK